MHVYCIIDAHASMMDEDITIVFLHGFETHLKIQCPRKPKPFILSNILVFDLPSKFSLDLFFQKKKTRSSIQMVL